MAGKETFLLALEDFDDLGKLTDREAGLLLKAIVEYQATGEVPGRLPVRSDVMFGYIRRRLDRNMAKYEETCRKRAEAGRKGGIKKAEKLANLANAGFAMPEEAKHSEYEYEYDYDNEYENENKI